MIVKYLTNQESPAEEDSAEEYPLLPDEEMQSNKNSIGEDTEQI
jgi:hypothetical protein